MKSTELKVKKGGFILNNGLPDEFYAFADKDLSLTVEKNGGINSIKVWDIYYCNGKPYPDAYPTPPIIRKSKNTSGARPLYGPGIRFVSECQIDPALTARRFYHFPEKAELYPFGFVSENGSLQCKLKYDLIIHNRSLIFRLGNSFPKRHDLQMFISKEHFFNGCLPSIKNYTAYEASNPHSQSWRPRIQDNESRDALPFQEQGEYKLSWEIIVVFPYQSIVNKSGCCAAAF